MERSARLRTARALATWLDEAFRIPGTTVRIGLDPLIGLVPGIGDAVGTLASAYLILIALQLGAPASVAGRMVLNLLVDAVVGAIPVLGDLFDFGWKGNKRNLALLEAWMAEPRATHRASSALALVLLAATVAIAGGIVYGAWRLVGWAAAGRALGG